MQQPSNDLAVSIREAMPADSERIVALALQLGYETPLAHVEALVRSAIESRAIFVAVVPRAGVVGWTFVAREETLIAIRRAEIHGLIVEDEFRSHRIGEMLVEAAEEWARKQGCATLRLLSNVVRERAHTFYARLGYDVLKTEYVFQKTL
ncbi:MAG TPA: GNAT family N-acetyltransferase [Candidatus Rubrimentiphilum sp.]|nr:GNAT family N-acetyltransferase [Candidatus Rubrimentiphilum sp.]